MRAALNFDAFAPWGLGIGLAEWTGEAHKTAATQFCEISVQDIL